MKKTHGAAAVCFAIAILLYLLASSRAGAGGFALIGFIFELMAWRKVLPQHADRS